VREVSALIQFGGEQVEYGGQIVLFKVGHYRGGVCVEETSVGLGGGDVEGVSDFTSRLFLAALVP
jgi:hypothetical protein